ncbi:MAG TPA: hypothetical protein VGO52_11565 [Hyphomonadaceae bacterium]|jgi:hypothetical protein|nr:hypothetical protein [Hyphomonadaceae bacterium]
MLRNFRIEDAIALKTEQDRFDLWNDYALVSIAMTGFGSRLDCIFKKVYPPHEADHGALALLAFRGVEFVGLQCKPPGDSLDVDEVGFKARQDNDLGWLIQEGQQDGSEDLIFRFGQAGHMRVKAAHAEIAGVGNV